MNSTRYGKGTARKAHDVCGFDGCSSCHEYFDRGHATKPVLNPEDFHMAVLGAVLDSYVRRIGLGIIKVPQDKVTPMLERSVKPRKERSARAKVPNNPDRKIPSRAMRRKETTP